MWRVSSVTTQDMLCNCHTCAASLHCVIIIQTNPRLVGNRPPVLATSSTLHHFQGDRLNRGCIGDPLHVDSVYIPGARIQNLSHAFAATYFCSSMTTDVCACISLNDVVDGGTPIEIMAVFEMFDEAVKYNLPGSTVAICTLPLPPMLVRFNGDNTEWFQCFQDKSDFIIEVNQRIIAFNSRLALRSGIQLETRGLRTRLPTWIEDCWALQHARHCGRA